ncbi:hypothetical protein [Gemmatimonas groenlandica]|uniref:DUF5709 domain-containing protein n=1 Tax=Gemmatimonas groenlandica TaxID=2732249 RepID=A0A6M4IT88_9BACT|nr:hypothetical protein [Gemmatimonas groenlandica]QJR36696.1 hypothetical protein HKW67_14835 [Gemmatimonas groenlandica]
MTSSPHEEPEQKTRPSTPPAQDADVIRDADGLVVDEYSDDDFEDGEHMDALDQERALQGTNALEDVADDGDGIDEINLADAVRQDGADAEMRVGAESLSADELEDAAIGHELRGAAGVTRDDEVHGERMFDSPDGKGRQTPEGEQD